ncbi:MAG TPA: hypothetical protein VKZ63_11230 [Kofleriaceae bacterium]|nr:hypothetical protein [Kofleriaceae bacterium]
MSLRLARRAALASAACLATACGPRVDPGADEPAGGDRVAPGPSRGSVSGGPRAGGRDVLVGEMCPKAAAGRAAVLPMFVHGVGWSAAPGDLAAPLERRTARQFTVLGWDGRRVGLFSVAGAAQVDDGVAAIGGYAGGSPCERPRSPAGAVELEAPCVAMQEHCGLAVSLLEPSGGFEARPVEEDPDPVDLPVAGACVAGGQLRFDVDGDGADEAFPASAFLDESRGPAEEVMAVPAGQGSCEPRFALRAAVPPGDPRDWRGMDVLAVADFDQDGRREVVAVFQYAGRRTWALYSATDTPARLDLVGESVPWSAR